ncbi:MAG: nucleotide sugar dehydrogenase [Clostridiales bacterium]|nr:nucleotide sugar dehydrogenase [Clostridiales bacterium]
MDLFKNLIDKKESLSVIGLGYVGMPLAVSFAESLNVIGFDINEKKIGLYRSGIDPTREVGDEKIRSCSAYFTSDENDLKKAKFHIIAVPTPVNADHTPDLTLIENASNILGRNLSRGSVVVYESTVYPGATEDVCVPILEKASGLVCGKDFKIGYSPERINPGDKEHRLDNIVKIVSGMDEETLDTIADVYSLVIKAGIYRAPSIKVAEAAKVIENSQRDINIAFMNELSIIFNKMNIDTKEVLKAAKTKWNFIDFYPGLVGGHCIGVDPYYLTYKAEQMGYRSRIILSGRVINDSMGKYIAETLIKLLLRSGVQLKIAKVAILGFTFKENCPDTRNTRVIDIYNELCEYGVKSVVADPVANSSDAFDSYGITFTDIDKISDMDAVVIAVAHDEFKKYDDKKLASFFKNDEGCPRILFDIKGILDKKKSEDSGYIYWRL